MTEANRLVPRLGSFSLAAVRPKRRRTEALTLDQVPASRTLPALYVLDSIVKNVPTPYALYFGPKLYSIFMGAYTKVDNATRRKMDEMLKTWKEPVPGSLSTKPVFPIEQVRPIENALIAARNAAFAAQQNSFQGQQQLLRGRGPVPSRDTPTPPNGRQYQPPPQGHAPYPVPNGQHHPDAAPPQQPYPGHPVNVSATAAPGSRLFVRVADDSVRAPRPSLIVQHRSLFRRLGRILRTTSRRRGGMSMALRHRA